MGGETYERGPVKLYRADCLEFLPTLEAGSVDAVVTDPPYGILNVASGNTTAIRKSRRSQGSGKLKGRMINRDCFDWDSFPPQRTTLDMLRGIAPTSIIWGGNYMELPPARCILAWDKLQPWANFSQVEIAWTSLDRPAAIFRHDKSNIPDKQHPTQKPVELMIWCLGFANNANTILDPFAGSGTTAIACIRTGRKFIGCEIERKYFDIACARIDRELDQGRLKFDEKPPTETQRNLL